MDNKAQQISYIRTREARETAKLGSLPTLDLQKNDLDALAHEAADRRVPLFLRTAQLAGSGRMTAVEIRESAGKTEDIYEKILQKSNLLPAWFLSVGLSRSRAVCRVSVSDSVDFRGQQGSWVGTGFLVAEDILLTNHHVLNTVESASKATCLFNFELDERGIPFPAKDFRLAPEELFVTSKTPGGLDFTFVRVHGSPGKEFGFIALDRGVTAITNGEFANVIQHPSGRPKELALQENTVIKQDQVVLHYSTDTEPGSSGSPVFNNEWKLVALHHASPQAPAGLPAPGFSGSYVNEGIKPSAIATHLEQVSQDGDGLAARSAEKVLQLFRGADELAGYFGSLGRRTDGETDVERVVNSYRGEEQDLDLGFWNIEWFCRRYQEKLDAVSRVILSMNLDIWGFSETSREATEALRDYLNAQGGQRFECAFSEPDAPPDKQTNTVLWNARTVKGERREWPPDIHQWFGVKSQNFDDLNLEGVEGDVFPRYPGLFHFAMEGQSKAFDFHLVPLHLKAMADGSKRRRMASAILAAAIQKMISEGKAGTDWVVGGDLNAELATGDFQKLLDRGNVAISAEDEGAGSFSYIKSPKSLIDHIFLSPNLARSYGATDYFIVARDKEVPGFVKEISDHRPVLIRLSLRDPMPETAPKELRRAGRGAAKSRMGGSATELRNVFKKLGI
ncbi:MAG: trypsin-like peptidase domain-containing protein [Planctomycetes bacterium]|nr:trypsin-like peptidase domain-containing protein [Planctomycetota bacterium]